MSGVSTTQAVRARPSARGSALLVSCLAAAVLAGCKTAPPQQNVLPGQAVAQNWDARRSQLQNRQSFELKGRVAVAAGNDGFNARLLWRQSGSRSNVALDGPLGAGGVQITNDGGSLSVTTAHGDRLDSEAAKAELKTRLGFEPPLGSLRYWILGVPDPAQPYKEVLDDQQHLASVEQSGWTVDYGAYMAVGSESLPSKVTLQREGVRVRLIVDGWTS